MALLHVGDIVAASFGRANSRKTFRATTVVAELMRNNRATLLAEDGTPYVNARVSSLKLLHNVDPAEQLMWQQLLRAYHAAGAAGAAAGDIVVQAQEEGVRVPEQQQQQQHAAADGHGVDLLLPPAPAAGNIVPEQQPNNNQPAAPLPAPDAADDLVLALDDLVAQAQGVAVADARHERAQAAAALVELDAQQPQQQGDEVALCAVCMVSVAACRCDAGCCFCHDCLARFADSVLQGGEAVRTTAPLCPMQCNAMRTCCLVYND